MKKILLVSGCSNTEKNFHSEIHPEMDCSWPKWPELLAKKLDMDCINLGKSGQGNEYIYTSLLEYITENDLSNIALVIPAWTQCQRKDFSLGSNMRWTNDRIDKDGDVFSWMRRALNYCVSFQIMCERYNLEYMQVQMLSPYIDWLWGLKPRDLEIPDKFPEGFRYRYPGDAIKDNKKIVSLIDSYENRINIKKFLGWPLYHEFGGYSLQKRLIGWNNAKFKEDVSFNLVNPAIINKYQTMISLKDNHPNRLGHELIAEFIYDRLG